MASQFPLGKVTTAQLQQLGEVLWSWSICAECLAGKPCKTEDCPWPRSRVLNRYFDFYKVSASMYACDVENGQTPGLTSHEDLFQIIRKLKSNPELTKSELLEELFTDRPARPDQERALDLAVRVTVMINCSASRRSTVLLEHGCHQTPWNKNVTFSQFLYDIFPQNEHPDIEVIKENLRAIELKKHARPSFQPTDDLRNHLRLDKKAAVVEIFHHTAFLKEQLRLTMDQPQNLSVPDLVKIGVLPRPFALETLDTIQKLLFPLTCPQSKKLLTSLTTTTTSNFDIDTIRYDSTSIRQPTELNLPYHYFSTRLGDLYQELVSPTPRGFEKWFERNSSARFVMMAAVAGVIFAIFLGLVSLGVSGFQAYVGYMAWKYPAQPA